MKEVKVFIEISEYGYSAYMDDTPLDYGCIGEGKTVEETIADFKVCYEEMRKIYAEQGKPFEEVSFAFYFDTKSFLDEYVKVFSLSGLERITGINQTRLAHYIHSERRPSRKTIEAIQRGVDAFVKELTTVRLA